MAYVAKPDHFTYSGVDYFTNENRAEKLATTIRKYWFKRGGFPNVYVKSRKMGEDIVYDVRSDMINGLPQNRIKVPGLSLRSKK